MEFKVFQPKNEKDLSDTVNTALKQIEDRNYETSLIARGIPVERIRKYGFAFRGKEVLIGKKFDFNREKEIRLKERKEYGKL